MQIIDNDAAFVREKPRRRRGPAAERDQLLAEGWPGAIATRAGMPGHLPAARDGANWVYTAGHSVGESPATALDLGGERVAGDARTCPLSPTTTARSDQFYEGNESDIVHGRPVPSQAHEPEPGRAYLYA